MKTLFIGQNRVYLQHISSTNSYANELLRQKTLVDGTLIYTFNQEEGRGQRGSIWESEPNKNAAFSIILFPAFLDIEDQFLLSKITSLAVADLMTELLGKSFEVKIKWPNDIYVENKKIAGILIENTLNKNYLQSAVIGVGLNINQTHFFNSTKASSLALLGNKEFDKLMCVYKLCEFFEARYLQLKANAIEKINDSYLQFFYQKQEWKQYESDGKKIKGKIIGVTRIGRLIMEMESGARKEFDLKEVQFL